MVVNRLISLNKNLTHDFICHIERAKNVCIYKFGNYNIPKNIIFPNANAITLINCTGNGILNILSPSIFPNLNTINYLSVSTGNYAFHHRFKPNTKWVFPDKNYEYFNFMVEMGYGTKDPELIKRYVANKKIIDGKSEFDISYDFDLNVPDYGIVNGEWWRIQFYEYLSRAQSEKKIIYHFPVVNRVILNTQADTKDELKTQTKKNDKISLEQEQEKEENEVIPSQIKFYETK